MLDYLYLALVPVAGALGNLAQSVAAGRAERREQIDPGLLGRLARDRMYVIGFAAQTTGFVLAFLARSHLPLYLVQAGSSAAVGFTAVLGALLLGWRVSGREVVALMAIAIGLLLLVASSVPSTAHPLSLPEIVVLMVALSGVVVLAVPAARMAGPRAAVVLGALAGASFGILAVVSRPLAAGALIDLPRQPTFWFMIAAAVVGQSLLAAGLQRRATTATAAAMESTAVVLASGLGLFVLGDQVATDRGPWVAAGLAAVVGGAMALTVVVRSQHQGARRSSSERTAAVPQARGAR